MEHPPDHRAPGRHGTGGGAPVPAGDCRRETHTCGLRSKRVDPQSGLCAAAPETIARESAAAARGELRASQSPARDGIRADGPAYGARSAVFAAVAGNIRGARGNARTADADDSRRIQKGQRKEKRKLRWVAAGMFSLALLASDPGSDGKRWWSHVVYLADDKLEGRYTGSEGYRKAAVYVAGELERAGIKPAVTSGYFQPVKFQSREIVEEKSSLALARQGTAEPLTLG